MAALGRPAHCSRRFVRALRPEALEAASLATALDRLAERFRFETGIDARAVVTGPERTLGPEKDATLLRVAQEALANVRKHAAASRVALTLSYMDEATLLDVRDDGAGFDPDLVQLGSNGWQSGGFGLAGMRERVEDCGGTITIESAPREGTTVVVSLPRETPGPSSQGPAERDSTTSQTPAAT